MGRGSALDEELVRRAMAQAAIAAGRGDPPFGAVLVDVDGVVLLEAANAQVSGNDPTAHAEITLIRAAARELGIRTFERLTVATNAEPCSMCSSALVKANVAHIVYGAPAEPHMDPRLRLRDVLRVARTAPTVTEHVLVLECAAQIAAAREGAPAPD